MKKQGSTVSHKHPAAGDKPKRPLKYPPVHPVPIGEIVDEFRGKFEPEFWDEVLEVRLRERRRLQIK